MRETSIDKEIFHAWTSREIAAMHRATAWLRSRQEPEWQINRVLALASINPNQKAKKLTPMKGIK